MACRELNMIRRPMMYIASAFAGALITVHWLGTLLAMIPAVFCFLMLLSKNVSSSTLKISALLMLSYMSGVMSYVICDADTDLLSKYYGEEIMIVCEVEQSEVKMTSSLGGEESEYLQMKAQVKSAEGNETNGRQKVLIRFYPPDKKDGLKKYNDVGIPGSIIIAKGTPERPEGRRNPGCFDYSIYLRSIGIRTVFTADEITAANKMYCTGAEIFKAKVYGALYMIKEEFAEKLERSAGSKTAGLVKAILFGEKNDIDEETLDEFRKNGTAHVLAVSGLHIGIIYGFLSRLWVWKKGKLFFLSVMVFFMIYMIMASFSPSVVRAVIMVWLHVLANLTGQRYDMASAAFFTALLMLLANPMHIFNTGFQMSFLAVLTLSLMLPIIKKIYSGMFLGSLAIQAGLTPFTVYVFNYVSIMSVIVNVPIIFLTGMIVPAGMCCMVSMLIFQPAFDIISKVLFGLCSIMEELNDMTTIEGITVFDIKSPALWIPAVYYLTLLIFVSEEGRLLFLRKKWGNIAILTVLAVAASIVFGVAAGNDFKDSDVVFVDVGQGDCIHFRSGRNGDYLVDGGGSINYDVGSKTLKPYLLKNGASSIDGAFITHLHTDHYKGVAELCREGMVERIYVYEGYQTEEAQILEDTGLERDDIVYLHSGHRVDLGNGVSVEVLWPEKKDIEEYETLATDEEDENSLSLIMKINIEDNSIIATGDVDAECLDMLSEKHGEALDIDILKVAHHGSKYSDSERFTELTSPEYAVFQVGKNNFGHPNKGIVEKFRRKGIIIYRNDTDGAVAFEFKKDGKALVRTVKENQGGWLQSFTRKKSMHS